MDPELQTEHPAMREFDPSLYAVPYQCLSHEAKQARQAAGLLCSDQLEFRSLHTEVKANAARRQVELYVAAFGNVDDGGDVIPKGAFAKSIKLDGPKGQGLVKFFFNHRLLLGPVVHLEEDSKGLLMAGQVDDDPTLNVYLKHAESGAAAHGSIGYEAVRASKTTIGGQQVRQLDECKLYEGSLVIWPMNRQATLQSVKALRDAVPGTKGLYDYAEAVRCAAQISSCMQYIETLTTSEWAKLTPEEMAEAQRLLQLMADEKSSAAVRNLAQKAAQRSQDATNQRGKAMLRQLADSLSAAATHPGRS